MRVNPNAPAFPCSSANSFRSDGMPIRLAIAAQVIGHLSACEARSELTTESDVRYALEITDALIAAYNSAQLG